MPPMTENDLESLKLRLRQFAEERDWDQFHSPKNLAMALTVEAGELMEHFQWLTEAQSKQPDAERLAQIADEIADVQVYLIRLADKLDIDIPAAVAAIDRAVALAPAQAVEALRIKAAIPTELLEKYVAYVKTGVPGTAYVRLDPAAEWPAHLAVRLPDD